MARQTQAARRTVRQISIYARIVGDMNATYFMYAAAAKTEQCAHVALFREAQLTDTIRYLQRAEDSARELGLIAA